MDQQKQSRVQGFHRKLFLDGTLKHMHKCARSHKFSVAREQQQRFDYVNIPLSFGTFKDVVK